MPTNSSNTNLIAETIAKLRSTFDSGITLDIAFRKKQLEGIKRFLKEKEQDIIESIQSDLGRPPIEIYSADIAIPAKEAAIALKHLSAWMKPERVSTPLLAQPGKSRIYKEPYGLVLIIGPWNYPLNLVIVPLIGAIAAGNCAIIKPSEDAPATSSLIARFLLQYVDSSCVRVIEGGVSETTELLAQKFDYIFYTGNSATGRIIMEAAAKNLTPVTLELGGKCPCIVDKLTDIKVAARRIIWGKFFNAGQTCVAPDYVLVHEAIEEDLLLQMKHTLHNFFGDNPRTSPDFGRIINNRHFNRLVRLLKDAGVVVAGGEFVEAEKYIAPTILRNVPENSAIMAEEIFGPILPLFAVKNMEDAISFIKKRPKPLALYLFSNNKALQQQVLSQTSSGGVLINHTALHFAVPSLPFGGVGESGLGAYHASQTFETFSHRKSVLIKPTFIDPDFQYPPYNARKAKWLKRVL